MRQVGAAPVIDTLPYTPQTGTAAGWQDYSVDLQRVTWTRLQSTGVDAPGFAVPVLVPPRPGRRWELQVEGFVRLGVSQAGTIYIGVQTAGLGGVSGGKLFTTPGEDLVPIMQRLPVTGGEQVYFSLFATGAGVTTATLIPNPLPYWQVREVRA
jgi:hypothetical protein